MSLQSMIWKQRQNQEYNLENFFYLFFFFNPRYTEHYQQMNQFNFIDDTTIIFCGECLTQYIYWKKPEWNYTGGTRETLPAYRDGPWSLAPAPTCECGWNRPLCTPTKIACHLHVRRSGSGLNSNLPSLI